MKHVLKTLKSEGYSSLSFQERKDDAQNLSFLNPFLVEKQDCLLHLH